MKRSVFIILILSSLVGFAQFPFEIGEPIQITNLEDNCKKPATIRFPDEGKVMMFYEKSVEGNSRQQIWAKNLLNLNEDVLIFENDTCDFLSPLPIRLTDWGEPDTLVLFFTLFDNEMYHIKYVTFDTDLNMGVVETFTSSLNNPQFFLNNSQGFCSWIDNNEVKTSRVIVNEGIIEFDSIITHDSGNCSQAKVSFAHGWWDWGTLLYIKDSTLYFKHYSDNTWGDSVEEFADSLTYLDVNFMETFGFDILGHKISWVENGNAKICDDDFNMSTRTIYYSTSSGENDYNITNPATFPTYTLVGKYNLFYFYGGVTNYSGNPEVFLEVEWVNGNSIIISNDEYPKGKLYFFTGLDIGSGGTTQIEIVWEEIIDGKIILFHNDIQFDWPTGIYESETGPFNLSISPNPISNSATITYYNIGEEDITIEILNIEGKPILKMTGQNQIVGQNKIIISQLESLKSGVYFLIMSQNEKKDTIVFIK